MVLGRRLESSYRKGEANSSVGSEYTAEDKESVCKRYASLSDAHRTAMAVFFGCALVKALVRKDAD